MARILLAEDDDSLRVFLTANLGRAGHEVSSHDNGDSAWDALERSSFDLLLTDIVMPGEMDGRDLARVAVTRRPTLRILLTSGFPVARWGGSTQPTGGRLLSKPYRKEELRRAVRDVLDDPR